MKIDFDGITSILSHKGIKGLAREDLLKKYLRDLIPQKYAIASGIICDSNENQSRQQDFIIYDSFTCPTFYQFDSTAILPVESVYATIEIKSSLNSKTLKECVENINSVRKLQRTDNNQSIKITNGFSSTYPLGFVFAYTSTMSLKKLILKMDEYEKKVDQNNSKKYFC